MSKTAAKDFDSIADDYMFFERHATEAREDARVYALQVAEIAPARGPMRMLDFGCGAGAFTMRFLELAGWPRERLHLTLVDPAVSARHLAVKRLASFTSAPITETSGLPPGLDGCFEVVLSNHALYYVSDLQTTLARLIQALAPTGILLAAIAARTNALIEFWIAGFNLLGRDVPYNTSEDVERALQAMGAAYRKHPVSYTLTFPDTEENRMRIIRFLLADHLAEMPLPPLMEMFDRYRRGGRIEIHTDSDHFTLLGV
ncbi:methyltransferase domain-containing protein [Hyphomicrobium sp.]|uniref:class I SAM-dependent methyltransferase n=1 Tax=Hyphomicrobium sp. TaxID=82 RepID=UPI0025BB4115|nr:methyltransferase domain-containing protein [Hyphomicrobium sp.]MCC7251756.1 methyltransferase domain-containing protein [Hyphomicrobium sp.]